MRYKLSGLTASLGFSFLFWKAPFPHPQVEILTWNKICMFSLVDLSFVSLICMAPVLNLRGQRKAFFPFPLSIQAGRNSKCEGWGGSMLGCLRKYMNCYNHFANYVYIIYLWHFTLMNHLLSLMVNISILNILSHGEEGMSSSREIYGRHSVL